MTIALPALCSLFLEQGDSRFNGHGYGWLQVMLSEVDTKKQELEKYFTHM